MFADVIRVVCWKDFYLPQKLVLQPVDCKTVIIKTTNFSRDEVEIKPEISIRLHKWDKKSRGESMGRWSGLFYSFSRVWLFKLIAPSLTPIAHGIPWDTFWQHCLFHTFNQFNVLTWQCDILKPQGLEHTQLEMKSHEAANLMTSLVIQLCSSSLFVQLNHL